MIPSRVQRLQQRLAEAALDGLVVCGRQNVRYLTGFTGSSGILVVARQAERPVLITDFRYVEQAAQQAPGTVVEQFRDQMAPVLAEVLRRLGLERVGFEQDHLTYQAATRWMEEIGQVRWVPVDQQVEALRAVKEPEELQRMRRAVELGDRAFQFIVERMRPGMTEKEVAWQLEVFLREHGAEALAFPVIVASGPNGALPHARPTDRRLEVGDLVVLDFGCVVDGYCSDMTRTVLVGSQVSPRVREVYELVLRAQETGVQAVRPGRRGQEVDAEARAVIEQAGLGEHFGHGLGHGVGLEVHEPIPRLARTAEMVLEPGMVTSVEPGVYLPGWGGVRIEDLVVVTPQGCEVLTRSPKELLCVGAG